MSDQATKASRAESLFEADRQRQHARTDRMFAVLMVAQWAFAILLAVVLSPYAWEGKVRTTHVHVQAALLLGGLLTALPVALALWRPGRTSTRMVIAVAQMLWSALLIHLSGGRIETHFHVFGSLAFLAFYKDWRVLVPATLVVAGDHFLRGLLWPESVYGVAVLEWWRFLEHAGWVVFEDVVLVAACVQGTREMREDAGRRAALEELSQLEQEKSQRLDRALLELQHSQQQLVRTEKLAAIGQLAASVSHELRNPLTAISNAHAYVAEAVSDRSANPADDPSVGEFLGIANREIRACNRIIGELLDFAREQPLEKRPCPLPSLVQEAIGLVPPRANVTIANEIPSHFPALEIDPDAFRKVMINLVQNAVEAFPPEAAGTVRVTAHSGDASPVTISVEDDGPGMSHETAEQVFQPLFTTKTKGTGLGLAIVASTVSRHQGTIRVESAVGKGSKFIIQLPAARA